MRIGIEAQRLFRAKKHGMDIVALELIRNLQEVDDENEYHIFVKKDVDDKCLNLYKKNFHLHVLPAMPYPVWEQVYLPLLIRRYKLDLLHCTANTAPIFCSCPRIVTLHDIIFLEVNPLEKGSWYQKFGNLYRRWVVPGIARSSEMLITVSEFEQKRIKEYFNFTDGKVQVVYNGVGKHFFSECTQEELQQNKQKYRLPENYILFLGNKNPKKNLPNVIRAYDRYFKATDKPLDLVVLDFDKESLVNFIKAEKLSESWVDRVHYPGYVPNLELPKLIRGADIFLYPSLRESFGIPILEGMACGIPVITSDSSSMPEVAGDAALLVDPQNVQAIAEAIIRVQDNSSFRTMLIDKGYTRSREFSWEASALKSIDLYTKVVKQYQ